MLAYTHTQPTVPRLHRFDMRYAVLRALLAAGSYLSDGIATGFAYGFDSGPMLDYAYRNQPAGRPLVGRLFDRLFLSQIGWRAMRARQLLLQQRLRELLGLRVAAAQATLLLDPAAGAGRCYLELLGELNAAEIQLVCRDRDAAGLAQGRRLAASLGLAARARYERCELAVEEDLARLRLHPDLLLVVGVCETLADDAALLRLLQEANRLLAPGGVLLFSTQIAHPQLELIANVLTTREGRPWLLAPRPLARAGALARAAGFDEVRGELEPYGLFGLTICSKQATAY